jgi:3-oxoacyl-[acyl-carrier protein] reductase
MPKLQDKVAIITGGAQGIGRATAELFAREGAVVVIWDINSDKTAVLVADLLARGMQADMTEVDITSLVSVAAGAKQVNDTYGRIDILVNNAGITRDATLVNMTSEQWEDVIDVNLKGVFHCTKAVAPYMISRNYGRIINTSSVVGVYGNFGQTNYAAAKAGLIGMTKVWSRELGRKGITVNAVAPGFIETEMVKAIPAEVISQIKEKIPSGKTGKPIDVANAYLFLASDEASYVNGTVLHVDGGMVG